MRERPGAAASNPREGNAHMSALTPRDFLRLLEAHLQPLHVPFSRAALQAFVEACWPWMEDRPDVELWATKFLATRDVMTPA
jgi:hypothetical protein